MRLSEAELDHRLRETLGKWADQGQLPPERVSELTAFLQSRTSRHPRRALQLTAAAGLVLVLLTVPQVRAWATDAVSELPFVGQFIQQLVQQDRGWEWAVAEEALQAVVAVDSHDGYTLRVHRILSDPTQTSIVFSLSSDTPFESQEELLERAHPRATAEGAAFSTRQQLQLRIIEGVCIGKLELEPLPQDAAQLEFSVSGLGEQEHEWRVNIPLSLEEGIAASETLYIELNQELEVREGLTLQVQRAVLSPVQTVVEARYQGPDPAFDLFGGNLQPRLVADSQPLAARSPYGTGSKGSTG